MARDLRSYLQRLESRPGDLLTIDRPVKPPEFEVTALLKHLDEERQYPAVLFEHPTDMYGQPSPFRLLTNLYATRQRCAMMLDVDPATPYHEVSVVYAERAARLLEPVVIPQKQAPVLENVWTGVDADAGRLPIVKHFDNRRWVHPPGHRSGFGATNWEDTKLVIDATRPQNVPFGSRAAVPAEVLERIKLADYLPGAAAPARAG